MIKSPKLTGFMLAGAALLASSLPMSGHAWGSKEEKKSDDATSVTLSAEARRVVQQDRVTATLAIESQAKTSPEVQTQINTKMQAAQKLYSAVSSVKASTGTYNVYKDYPAEPAPKKDGTPAWTPEEREKNAFWRGSQELQLDGVKSDELLGLIASLQKDGFAVRGLNFYMSRSIEDSIKDELIVEALGNIKVRAENIKKALGAKEIFYSKIDLANNGVRPMPMARGAMMMKAEAFADAADVPAPVAEAGETEVVVNVTAEVKLK